MFKKVCFYIFLFFCLILNIIVDLNVKNYINVLNNCFNKNITLDDKLYISICFIIALITILIILDILLVVFRNKKGNKGIKIKKEDGTHGTADWMSENEISKVLGLNDTAGIILGKYNNSLVKLPFDSHFNKNICVFGSSGSMKTIRLFINEFARTIKI